ncbi:MAG: hypothetical protein Q7R31_00390 [Candidatus Levybacteria bacterium]|nr:hypothetical protein [Candidatus Levybacteria bacterium]
MNEALRPENSGKPNIINTTILVKENEVVIPTVDGKPYRERKPAQLGKRFVCAQEIVSVSTREIVDPKTNESTMVTTQTSELQSGEFKDTNGNSINLGCGTQVLCTKASDGIPSCCDIPMTLVQPKPLPSSD